MVGQCDDVKCKWIQKHGEEFEEASKDWMLQWFLQEGKGTTENQMTKLALVDADKRR